LFSALTSEGGYEPAIPKGDRVMKNTQLSSKLIACALTIGSLAMSQPVSAQSRTALAVVNIPFPFQTELQTLPAGTYRIDRESSHIVLLLGPGDANGFVRMNDAIKSRRSDNGTLVFDRLGDKYFLRQIWTAGSTDGLESPMSRVEKQSLVAANLKAASSTEVAINGVPKH
jgi:hypothetical protein